MLHNPHRLCISCHFKTQLLKDLILRQRFNNKIIKKGFPIFNNEDCQGIAKLNLTPKKKEIDQE